MNWKWVRSAALVLTLPLALQACDSLQGIDELEVVNQNNPDTERALVTPGDIEALIGSSFNTWQQGAYERNAMMISAMGDEGSASWGNFGMRDNSSEPRPPWDNTSSYGSAASNERPWYQTYEALSGIYDGLNAIAADPLIGNSIDVNRATAFAKFIQGISHGWLAMWFDSAFVFDESIDIADPDLELLLSPYPTVLQAALGFLDEAIAMGNAANWNTPDTWILGNELSGPDLAKVASGFAARFLSQVGRTPADRAAQDWNRILTYANNGVTEDLLVASDGADQWWDAMKWYGGQVGSTWTRADYRTIGYTEAGQGKGYDNWLATPVAFRVAFDLDVPDRRITPGPPPHVAFETDGLDFGQWGQPSHPEARGTYHWSWYGHFRYEEYPNTGGLSSMRWMSVDEMNLLKAEAMIRLGQSGAAALINNTRVTRGALPPVTDADADLMQSLFYEVSIENYILCPCAYFNRRGWGPVAPNGATHHFGLIEGTPLHFPVPGAELEILQKANYTYGGAGNEGSPLQPGPSAQAGYASGGRGVPAQLVYRLGDFDSPREVLDYWQSKRGVPRGVSELARYH